MLDLDPPGHGRMRASMRRGQERFVERVHLTRVEHDARGASDHQQRGDEDARPAGGDLTRDAVAHRG